MSTSALESQGVTIGVGDAASPEAYTDIPDVMEISGPDGSAAEIDVTDLSSSAKEFRRGLPDNGSVSLTLFYRPAQTQHAQLKSDFDSSTEQARNYRITFTDSPATTWTFSGYVASFSISNSIDAALQATVSLRVKGAITEA